MARILFTVWPLTGHIHPNLAIAHEVAALGHQVAFYTGTKFQKQVEAEGFGHFAPEKVNQTRVEELLLSPQGIQGATGKPLRLRARWRECVLDSVPGQLEDLNRLLDAWHPDVIVCDPTMWGPFLVLHEARRIPVAIFSLIPACHLSGSPPSKAQGPVVGFSMPRPRSAWQRRKLRTARAVASFFLRGIHQRANEIRSQAGLPPITTSVTDHAGTMPLYLVPSSPEFDYNRTDLPPSVHYVGPCLLKGGEEALPEWIEKLPRDEPLIYASEGTVHLEPKVLRAVAQGLADRRVQVIMTTGKHRDPASIDFGIKPLPPNIHVSQWVPLNPLLPRLSGMVTIGGPSTMMAALELGIPVVIVPFAWDHPETGWRVQESGAGVHLRPPECTPENMRRAVEKILKEPSFRENAQRLAETFRRCGGAPAAARLIAKLAG